jgi:maltoporin
VMQVKGGKEVTLTPGSSAELAAQEAGKRAALGKSKDVGAKYQGKLPSEPTYDMLQEADRKIEKLQEQVGTFEFHGYLRSGYGLNGEGGSRLHSRHPGLMRNTALEMKRKPMRN